MSAEELAQAKFTARKAAVDVKMAKELRKLQSRNAKLIKNIGKNNARIAILQTLAGSAVVNEGAATAVVQEEPAYGADSDATEPPVLERQVSCLG